MMVEISLKKDPLRPTWQAQDEAQDLLQTAGRRRIFMRSHVWRPPTDVYETEIVIVVRVEIAGMKEEDFTVSLSERFLVIRGLRPDMSERRAFHQMEIFFGEFMSEVELPCPVVAESAEAEYSMGFLKIVLPKQNPRRIYITE